MTLDLAAALAARGQNPRANAQTVIGWVTAFSGTKVTVTVDGQSVTMPRLRAYDSPIVNDVVLVLKSGRAMYCLGALNAAPITPPTPPPPPPSSGGSGGTPTAPSVTRTVTYRPVSTGTYRGGGWRGDTSDVYQGDWSGNGINYGAAFYGTNGPSSLAGTALAATVRVKREAGGVYAAQRPTLRLLTEKVRSGFPDTTHTLRGPALAIGDTATVDLPATWAQRLIDGSSGGIGIGVGSSSPYVVTAGKASWGPAYELTITYQPA